MLSAIILRYTLCLTAVWLLTFFVPIPIGWGLLLSVVLYVVTARIRVWLAYRVREKLRLFMENDNAQTQQRINTFSSRHGVSARKAREFFQSERQAQIRRFLEKIDELNQRRKGRLLTEMQDYGFKLALFWELKDWEQVDRILAIIGYGRYVAPDILCYALLREQQLGIESDDDNFNYAMRFKGCRTSPYPYAVRSWVLMQSKQFDRALALLTEACKTVKDTTLEKNRDALARKRPDLYSNATLPDWARFGLSS